MRHTSTATSGFQGRGVWPAAIALLICLLCGCSNSGPVLVLTPDHVDLGDLEEGVEVTRSFTIKNTGFQELKIYEVHSSCGCTVPNLKKRTIPPSDSAVLEVLIDTSMKQGTVEKKIQVSSNDIENPVVNLRIKMHVKNRHKGLSNEGRAKIFTSEKCTSCHVDRGVGLAGKDLYEADCAMCHGKDAKGEVGGALIYGDYTNPDYVAHIRDVICYGSKSHRSMPGFLDIAGGPLVKEQIESLVEYLKTLSAREKTAGTTNRAERKAPAEPTSGK